jgi:DNA transformation protein
MKRRKSPDDSFYVEARDTLRGWLEERLGGLPEFEVRRLFGGAGLYSGDTIFGIYYDRRVFLKVDATTRDDFIERASAPFRPRSGRTLASYYEVPADVMDDEDEFVRWSRRALAAASGASRPSRTRGPAQSPRKKRAKHARRSP